MAAVGESVNDMDRMQRIYAVSCRLCEDVLRAGTQLRLVEEELRRVRVRIRRPRANGNWHFVRSYEIQIQTSEGMRCMYEEYTARKMRVVRRIKKELRIHPLYPSNQARSVQLSHLICHT